MLPAVAAAHAWRGAAHAAAAAAAAIQRAAASTKATNTSTATTTTSTSTTTVLAWGRNAERACGVEGGPVVTAPTVLLDFYGRSGGDAAVAVRAGKLSSAAITRGGEVLTWGDGRLAQGGHGAVEGGGGGGSNGGGGGPCVVEALVGRALVRDAALADGHSLLLDARGGVWAVGANMEGQLGLGTPIEELARQRRAALQGPHALRAAAQSAAAAAAAHAAARSTSGLGWLDTISSGGGARQHEAYLHALGQQRQGGGGGASSSSSRQSLVGAFMYGGSGGGGGGFDGGGGGGSVRSQQAWASSRSGNNGGGPALGLSPSGMVGFGLERQLSAAPPGVVASPVRVAAPRFAAWPRSGGGGGGGVEAEEAWDEVEDLAAQRVVCVAAARHFSAAVTDAGEVWTWGADFSGALGREGASWAPAPARVGGALAAAIAAGGGAVSVAASSGGVACLTAGGKVILFGGFAGAPAPGRAPPATGRGAAALKAAQRDGFAVAALPAPARGVAAGQQHVAVSDGERVWAIGRMLDGSGREALVAPFWKPAELLALPGAGVAKVAAGAHSTAAVGGDGALYLGGRLFDRRDAEALLAGSGSGGGGGGRHDPRYYEDAHQRQREHEQYASLDRVDWRWPGFGGAPQLRAVPGVSNVADVALGAWHAVVLCR